MLSLVLIQVYSLFAYWLIFLKVSIGGITAVSPVDHVFVFCVGLQQVLLSKYNLLLEKQGCPYPSTQTNISKKYDLVLLRRNKRNIKGENKSIHLCEIPVKFIRNKLR